MHITLSTFWFLSFAVQTKIYSGESLGLVNSTKAQYSSESENSKKVWEMALEYMYEYELRPV